MLHRYVYYGLNTLFSIQEVFTLKVNKPDSYLMRLTPLRVSALEVVTLSMITRKKGVFTNLQ